jgi:anthranilate synthase component 2
MKILLIDNYDSFTFNLYHYLSSLKTKVDVIRNDKITSKEIRKNKYDKIVISPGPGNPNQSGNCLDIFKYSLQRNSFPRSMFGSSNYRSSFWF